MPSRNRIFAPDSVYHVYCKTAQNRFLFDDHDSRQLFVDTLTKISRRDRVQILHWVLLSNHYHLAVRTGEIPLWKTMMSVHGVVSSILNRRAGTRGPNWQSRYRAKIVTGGAYYRHLLAYISLNPVVAGLVHEPSEWIAGGHRALIGQAPGTLVQPSISLAEFGPDVDLARAAFDDYLSIVCNARGLTLEPLRLPWWEGMDTVHETVSPTSAPLGSQDFEEKAVFPELPSPSIGWLIDLACQILGYPAGNIRSDRRKQPSRIIRSTVARLAVVDFGLRVGSVARALGRDRSRISVMIHTPESEEERRLRRAMLLNLDPNP